MELDGQYRNIELLLLDVDGVLTDGRLYFGAAGEELKIFDVRDGYGIKLWHEAGFRSGIISGRNSGIVSRRAAELKMSFVYQGNDDKVAALEELVAEAGVVPDRVAYIGDDTLDIPVIEKVGLGVAVADAHERVQRAAHYITKAPGGRGAVREIIDMLLAAKSR
jgi:3-deoxy-D-manno-octulosonate 8-phosphate phosphatase (KDO 8-P phosphatase)